MLNLPIESWKTVITKVIEQTSQKGVSKIVYHDISQWT